MTVLPWARRGHLQGTAGSWRRGAARPPDNARRLGAHSGRRHQAGDCPQQEQQLPPGLLPLQEGPAGGTYRDQQGETQLVSAGLGVASVWGVPQAECGAPVASRKPRRLPHRRVTVASRTVLNAAHRTTTVRRLRRRWACRAASSAWLRKDKSASIEPALLWRLSRSLPLKPTARGVCRRMGRHTVSCTHSVGRGQDCSLGQRSAQGSTSSRERHGCASANCPLPRPPAARFLTSTFSQCAVADAKWGNRSAGRLLTLSTGRHQS